MFAVAGGIVLAVKPFVQDLNGLKLDPAGVKSQ